MTEHELIPKALAGDATAFEDLVGPHLASAYRTALLLTNCSHAAQEAVQEGLIEVYRSLPRFRPDAAFRPWFMKIMVHRALNQKRRVRKTVPLDQVAEPVALDGDPERACIDAERQKAIWAAVHQLDPDQRTVVVFYYYQEFSVAEIAQLLKIPEGTVKCRLHSARRLIESRLNTGYTPCHLSVIRHCPIREAVQGGGVNRPTPSLDHGKEEPADGDQRTRMASPEAKEIGHTVAA